MQNRDSSISRTQQGNKAKGLYACAQTKAVWLMLHFLVDVLDILSSVSKKFQSQTACISEVLTEIEVATLSLEKMNERNGLKLRQALKSVPEQLTGDDRSFVSARQKLLTAIVESLHRRFTDKPGILAAVSTFNLSLFPSDTKDLNDFGDDEVDELVDQFSRALEDASVDVNLIAHEWTKLKQQLPGRFASPINELTWADVNSRLGKACPNILALIDLVHTIPASSADAERGFSYLKNTKTASRNKLLDTNLSNQLMIVLETEGVEEYDPTEAVLLWNEAAIRRPRQEKSQGSNATEQLDSRSGHTAVTSEVHLVESSENENEAQNRIIVTTEQLDNTSTHTATSISGDADVQMLKSPISESEEQSGQVKCSVDDTDSNREINNNSLDENNNDENNNDANNNESEKKSKLVGGDSPIPCYTCQGTQTDDNSAEEILMDDDDDEYSSDCDFYVKELTECEENLFEKRIQYEDRLVLAKKAYNEFLMVLNSEAMV